MSGQLIWLKFINPDDVYELNPSFDDAEKQCFQCCESLYILFRENELNDWSIVQPKGNIDSGFIKVPMFEPLVLKNEENGKTLLLEDYSFRRPDSHSCQSDRESNENT